MCKFKSESDYMCPTEKKAKVNNYIFSDYISDGQCTFPNDFIGTWESSSDGTWTINSSHWLDLKVTGLAGINSLSFVCYEVQGNVYALQ